MTITGLPFPVTSMGGTAAGYYAGFAGLGGPPVLLIDSNGSGIRVYDPGPTSSGTLTDAQTTNSAQFRANFVYRTN